MTTHNKTTPEGAALKEREQQDPESREQRSDDFKLPEERVEDLEPREEDSAEVKGGAFPKKVEFGP